MDIKRMPNKIESFQGLRAIAFLGIFLSHMKTKYFTGTGAWGVSVFLILSGFLMINNYFRKNRITHISIKDNFRFSLAKIQKLYPLHIAMMIIAIPLMIYDYVSASESHIIIRSFISLLTNIFLIQSWFPKEKIYYSLNGVAWYLSVCAFIYFIFPYILNYIEQKYTKKKAVLSTISIFSLQIIVGFISSILPLPWSIRWDFPTWATYILPITRLGDFVIGCNMGYLYLTDKKFSCSKKTSTCIPELLAVLFSIGSCTVFYLVAAKTNVPAIKWWTNTSIFIIPSIILVYLSANNNNFISRILSNKLLVYLGNMSASLFLIHQMVFKYFEFIYKHLTKNEYVAKWYSILTILAISILYTHVWNKFQEFFTHK